MIPQTMRLSTSRGLGTRAALDLVLTSRPPHHRFMSLSSRHHAKRNNTSAAGQDGPKQSPQVIIPPHIKLAAPRKHQKSKPTVSNHIPPPDAVPGSASSHSPLSNSDISFLSTYLKSHNHQQLAKNIHETCSQFGAAHRWGSGENDTGMNRLALTDADKAARDWFVEEAKGLGCEVTVDEMGNIWAVRKGLSDCKPIEDGGKRKRLPPVMMGSHLDTQPRGGRYDGVLGVMAGLEALRVLKEKNVSTWRPVGVVNWTNEEGARFPISMVSSGVWAGEIPLEKAHTLKEVSGEGKTMREELERTGYLGDKKCGYEEMPMAAHFELHIEQGPILEEKGKKVGVVKGSQAYKWFTVEVVGKGKSMDGFVR